MKTVKNDNKGFSLVELIVVVLIMGILAVALAPQVMKWVDNSRINADQNAAGNLKSAVQIAIADFQGKGGTMVDVKYKVKGTTWTITTDTAALTGTTTKLSDIIKENLGGESYDTKYNNDGFTIEADSDGLVTITGGCVGQSLK